MVEKMELYVFCAHLHYKYTFITSQIKIMFRKTALLDYYSFC